MKFLTHIVLFIIALIHEPCPDFQDTIHVYSEMLSNTEYVSMKFEVITRGESAKWNDASEMDIIWHDGQVLYLDVDFERLVTKEFSVLVNHDARTIDIIRYAVPLNKIDVSEEMDKWLSQSDGIHTLDCNPTFDKLYYTFHSNDNGPIKSATYEFTKDERLLQQISQDYNKTYSKIDHVIMKFTNYNFVSKDHESRFSLNHYFNKIDESNGIVQRGLYSGYQLIFNELK